MRRFIAILLLLSLTALAGCATLYDILFGAVASQHHTDGATTAERYSSYQAQVEEQRRLAERYQQDNAATTTR